MTTTQTIRQLARLRAEVRGGPELGLPAPDAAWPTATIPTNLVRPWDRIVVDGSTHTVERVSGAGDDLTVHTTDMCHITADTITVRAPRQPVDGYSLHVTDGSGALLCRGCLYRRSHGQWELIHEAESCPYHRIDIDDED